MNYNLSACVFIRDCFRGAFCIFESIAALLPFADEFVVMDLGSTDGTLGVLQEITEANPKFKLILRDRFPETDAGVFASLANELIDFCRYDRVLYFQADEVPHEDLLSLMEQKFQEGKFDLSFWRIQFRENWQLPKWYPHPVHRVGLKDSFHFVGDGMTTKRTWDAELCSTYDGGWFTRWGGLGPEGIKDYVHEMIMDVSLVGGFLENIPDRRSMHAPFWHEPVDIENLPAEQWMERERQNPNWYKTETPYDIPAIMRWHVGKTRYQLRPELLQAIKDDRTREYIESIK